MNNGPGSVVDFLADGAAISAVIAGLDEWDRSFPPKGLNNPQCISEPRLQQKLSKERNWTVAVRGFRLPPVVDEIWHKETKDTDTRNLVAVRFPEWLQCPNCNRLAPAENWGFDPGRAYRYCSNCTDQAPGQRKIFAVPSRFMMACTKGHLDEFPWHFWIKHKRGCENKTNWNADLYLKSESPGLSGLILSCPKCNAERPMEGIFSQHTWDAFPCGGKRPWLASADDEACENHPRALQRGASNLYFPILDSALSIPPWSDYLQEAIGIHWNLINDAASPEDRHAMIRILLAQESMKSFMEEEDLNPEELSKQIEDRVIRHQERGKTDTVVNESSTLRQGEYDQYAGLKVAKDLPNFEATKESVPDELKPYFNFIVRVKRLREVRVLKGFTRINPPSKDSKDTHIAQISTKYLDWLPAIEVRGEGIFLDFNKKKIEQWKSIEDVKKRADTVDRAWREESKKRLGVNQPSRRITPVLLLIHTFAHAIMCQLTLECGYSTVALRERLYVSDDDKGDDMTGILIYTATSDSGGALGGLQRQGKASHIERVIRAAIRSLEWCSSDPHCIEGFHQWPENISLAACHACVLAPETACEEHNRFLDRALLVGLPDNPEVGFFSPLIKDV